MSVPPEQPDAGKANQASTNLFAGISLTVMAGVLIACMDAISKYLTADYPVVQIVWGRYVFHFLIVGATLGLIADRSVLRSRMPVVQLLRAGALAGATALLYTALARVPLADSTAVQFFAPVLVTLLAGLVLGEPVGWGRIGAVVVGFCGVLLVIRPGVNTDPFMLLPLAAAVLLAIYYLLTRLVGRADSTGTTLFYTTIVGAVLASLAVPFDWRQPDATGWVLMLAMGVFGAAGHFALVRAFAFAPASTLSPFLYAQLLAATGLSVAVFGNHLSLAMIAGATLLVASGLYVVRR